MKIFVRILHYPTRRKRSREILTFLTGNAKLTVKLTRLLVLNSGEIS